jgi:hypothetical protein
VDIMTEDQGILRTRLSTRLGLNDKQWGVTTLISNVAPKHKSLYAKGECDRGRTRGGTRQTCVKEKGIPNRQ